MTTPAFAASLHSFVLNEPKYLALLTKLIGVSEKLQNSPPQGLIPRENLASDIVKAELEPHLKANGGPLLWERIEREGRGNIKNRENRCCANEGFHVPASGGVGAQPVRAESRATTSMAAARRTA